MKGKYSKYKKLSGAPAILSVQELYGQKRDSRFEFRLSVALDKMIDEVVKEKQDYSKSDLTILLWLDYLSKTGRLSGKIKMKSVLELQEDVEYFIKFANKSGN